MAEGTLRRVGIYAYGSGVAAAATIGATQLVVDWAVDFSEEGGSLRIGEDTYAYDAVDYDSDTITLSTPLVTALEVGDPVEALSATGEPAVDWVAHVALRDSEEPVEAVIPLGLIPYFTVGDDQAGTIVRLSDDGYGGYLVNSRPNETGVFDGSVIDPSTLPDTGGPVDPPTESPTPTTQSVPGAVWVRWEWEQQVDYELHVTTDEARTATDPGADTLHTLQARPGWVSTAVGGQEIPLAGAWFALVAYNEVDAAPPSPWVTGIPAEYPEEYAGGIVAPSVLAAKLQGETIEGVNLVGATLDLEGSLYAEPGKVEITADDLTARKATFDDNVKIRGVRSVLEGRMTLGSGTVAPQSPPRVTSVWTNPSASSQSDTISDQFGTLRGLYDNGTEWISGGSFFSGYVTGIDKATGAVTGGKPVGTALESLQPYGGVTKVGTDWFLAALDGNDFTWRILRFNNDWTPHATAHNTYLAHYNTIGHPAITSDGTDLFLAYRVKSNNARRLLKRDVAGNNLAAYDTAAGHSTSEVTGLYVGTADFGTTRAVIAGANSLRAYSFSGSTLTRQTTHDWSPANGEEVHGLAWDGTRFHTLCQSTGRIWHYGRHVVDTTYETPGLQHSWWDSTAPDHETEPGDAIAFTVKARTWTRVETDAPNDTGQDDDPNQVRIYVDDHRQADLGEGVTAAVYDLFDLTGAAGRTTNGFADIAGTIGSLQSTAEDGDGAIIDLDGAGDARVGPYSSTPDGDWVLGHLAGNADGTNAHDTGWLNITQGAGYVHVAGDAAQVRQIDGKLYWQGTLRRSSGTGTAAGTLPAGITLSRGLATMIRSGNQWIPWIIGASGALTISSAVVTGQDINVASAAGANGMLVD